MNSTFNLTKVKPNIGIAPEKVSHLVNHYVLDVHAEDAAFLWTQHSNAVKRPDYHLKDIIELDEYLNAHLDGLIVANTAGWNSCLQLLDEGVEHLFPATIVALVQQNHQWLEIIKNVLLDLIDSDGYYAAKPVISALGWLDYTQVSSQIDIWLASKNPVLQYIALAGLSVQRQDPSHHLNQLIHHGSPYIRARAYRIAGELKHQDLSNELYNGLQEQNAHCRFWAAWSLALLGDRHLSLLTLADFAILSKFKIENAFKYQRLALQILFTVQHQNQPLQKQLLEHFKQNNTLLPAMVYALGVTGNPQAIDSLIELMKMPKLAKLAGEAFCMITGADLDYDDLTLDDEDDDSNDEQLPEITDINLDTDTDIDDFMSKTKMVFANEEFAEDYQNYIDDLLLPDAKLIQSWWQTQQVNFAKNTHYLVGLPTTENNLHYIIKSGFQRQRQVAALLLALNNQQQILLNTQEQGLKQQ